MKKPPQPSERKCKLPRHMVSQLEATFEVHLSSWVTREIAYIREWQFDSKRKWKFDFAFPSRMVAVELEGGTWSGGRHTRGSGYEKDCEKYNAAALAGWKVGRFTSRMVNNGNALEWLKKALG